MGNQELWWHYRRKVINEILVCKRSYYANRVENPKSSKPRKWWESIKKISGEKKPSTNAINIVKDGIILSGEDLAQLLNDHFVNVSSDLSQLDISLLPAHFRDSCPVATIAPEEVAEKPQGLASLNCTVLTVSLTLLSRSLHMNSRILFHHI